MNNTQHIQGDAVRTAGSFANRLKGLRSALDNAGRSMGKYLLPAATSLVEKITTLVKDFNNLDSIVKANILKWTTLGSAVLGAVGVFGLLATAAQVAVKGLALVGGVISAITSPLVLAGVAIAGAAMLMYTAWEENWLGIQETVNTVWEDTLKPIFNKLWEWLQKSWDWTLETAGDVWKWLKNTSWKEKWDDIKTWMKKGWNWSIGIVGKAWDWLNDLEWKKSWDEVKSWMQSGWDWTIKTVGEGWNFIKQTSNKITSKIDIQPKIGKIFELSTSAINQIADTLGWINEEEDGYKIGEFLGKVIFKPFKIFPKAVDFVSGIFDYNAENQTMNLKLKKLVTEITEFSFDIAKGYSDSFLNALFGTTDKKKIRQKMWEPIASLDKLFPSIQDFGAGKNTKTTLEWIWNVHGTDMFKWLKEQWKSLIKWFDKSITTKWNFKLKGLKQVKELWKKIKDIYNKIFGQSQNGSSDSDNGKKPTPKNPNLSDAFQSGRFDSKKLGGMTANVGKNTIAGVVHGGEWVMPKWMVKRYPQLASMLEGMRKKGYKQGGAVGSYKPGGDVSFAGMNFNDMQGYISDISQNINKFGKVLVGVFEKLIDVIIEVVNVIGQEFLGIEDFDISQKFKDLDEWFDNLFKDNNKNKSKDLQPRVSSIHRKTGLMYKKSFWQKIADGLKKVKNQAVNLANTLANQSPILSDVLSNLKKLGGDKTKDMGLIKGAIKGGQTVGPIGAITSVLLSLVPHMKVFQQLMSMINPIMQAIADIVSTLLMPTLLLITPGLKLIADILNWAAKKIASIWNWLMKALSNLPFVDLKDQMIDLGEETNEATNAMRNVPSGFKIATRRFQSAQGRVPSAATGGTVKESGLVNVHAGEVIRNQSQQSDSQEIHVHFDGDVYGMDDFDRKVQQSVDKAKKRNGLNYRGISQAGGA